MARIWIALRVECKCGSWPGCGEKAPTITQRGERMIESCLATPRTDLGIPAFHDPIEYFRAGKRVCALHESEGGESPVNAVHAKMLREIVGEILPFLRRNALNSMQMSSFQAVLDRETGCKRHDDRPRASPTSPTLYKPNRPSSCLPLCRISADFNLVRFEMDHAKELFHVPSEFVKEGTQVSLRFSLSSTRRSLFSQFLNRCTKPDKRGTLSPAQRVVPAKIDGRSSEMTDSTRFPRRVPPHLSGGRYWLRYHGRNRLRRQTRPYSHQQHSRRRSLIMSLRTAGRGMESCRMEREG